jgi:long-subunit acyl-CoA synthetase (AMP-forming)
MALGVARGERVVLWATNVPEWVVLQFAVAKAGAILVTANTSLRARDVDYLLRQSEAATLITIRGFRDVDYVNELTAIGRPDRQHSRSRAADLPGQPHADGFTPYEDLRAAASRVSDAELDARSASVGPDDVINMQYTSGTTGFPKGVMLSSRNIVNNGEALGRMLGYTPGRSPVPVRPAVSLLRLRDRRARRLYARQLPVSRSWRSIRSRCSRRSTASGARPSTVCRRCSSRSSSARTSRTTT